MLICEKKVLNLFFIILIIQLKKNKAQIIFLNLLLIEQKFLKVIQYIIITWFQFNSNSIQLVFLKLI